MTSQLGEELAAVLLGRPPLVHVQSGEEDRVQEALRELLSSTHPGGELRTWSCMDGWTPADSSEDTRDPLAALTTLMRDPQPGFHVMLDLPDFLDRPEIVRAVRQAGRAVAAMGKATLVMISPRKDLPVHLERELCRVEDPGPDAGELLDCLRQLQSGYSDQRIPEARQEDVALALRGLSLSEARHVLHRVFRSPPADGRDVLEPVFDGKKALLKKDGFLEYVPVNIAVEDIGGLDILKEWARKRQGLFTREALDTGMPIPKGVLIMGVSGCGKSMSAKAMAALWGLPLFRLDMNLVFSGLYGSPESAFHRALKAIESVAPAVLWIDEIENALGMTSSNATAEQALTFSSFLTWMQERPPLVFVAATANRIEALPAESIRKGRFDEVFFCDLPGENERRDIFRVHLRINGADPDDFDIDRLLHSTKGWSGAEIGQAVAAARVDARQEDRAMTLDDIRRHTTRMVPLSTTMSEQIRAIRSWAYQRATRASKAEPRSMIPGD